MNKKIKSFFQYIYWRTKFQCNSPLYWHVSTYDDKPWNKMSLEDKTSIFKAFVEAIEGKLPGKDTGDYN